MKIRDSLVKASLPTDKNYKVNVSAAFCANEKMLKIFHLPTKAMQVKYHTLATGCADLDMLLGNVKHWKSAREHNLF